jgi:hypothetical protein
MEFKVIFNNNDYIIKEGVILSFKSGRTKYNIIDVRKLNILSRISEYDFSLKCVGYNDPYDRYTKKDIIQWLSNSGKLTY